MSFSEKLKKLRKEKKVTQIELGKAIGKSNRVISYYENEENGTTIPPMEIIEPIAKYFNVPIDYFLNDSDNKSSKQIFVQNLLDLTIEKSTYLCNALNHLARYNRENDKDDLTKAIDYIERIKALHELKKPTTGDMEEFWEER